MRLSQLTKSRLEATWLVMRKKVVFRTCDDRYQRLKSALTLTVKRGYLKANPCELTEIVRPDLTEERILKTIAKVAKVSWDTLEKIVQHCAPEDRLKIIFAARTGIRQGEQIALKVYRQKHPLEGGIDFDNYKIHVRTAMKHALRRQDRYIGDPKSMAGFRNIPIDQELCDALRSYWEALPKRMKGGGLSVPVTGRHGP